MNKVIYYFNLTFFRGKEVANMLHFPGAVSPAYDGSFKNHFYIILRI